VLLLEAGAHPRAHVGESLLPGIIPILAEIGALPAVEAAGFHRKTGSTLWGWGRTPRWDLWFADSDAYDAAWFVDRSRFDALLLQHARTCGATVEERAAVREVLRSGDRVEGVRWQRRGGDAVETRAATTIDASGGSALIARTLGVRAPIEGLQHQCMWAHFEGARRLPAPREQQALFVAQPSQWWWMFPLADGRASVGVVQLDAAARRTAPRRDFDRERQACAELTEALGPDARRCTDVRHERDWSYRMSAVAGPGWMAVGDAAGFLDPVLSTGVMLALHTGWHAARSAATGDVAAYEARQREMFEDLLRIVRFYYRQNLHRDDYFWESKRILLEHDQKLAPQKAFVLLTSGLVGNLALEEQAAQKAERLETGALDFVGIHLRVHDREDAHASTEGGVPVRGSSLFLLVEPIDPGAPTLARTRNWHVNAVAPRHGNDPISVPALEGPIRSFIELVRELDTTASDLAGFWPRLRAALPAYLARLDPTIAFVRAFGD
jgi:flavin-dependent dehydrogenase